MSDLSVVDEKDLVSRVVDAGQAGLGDQIDGGRVFVGVPGVVQAAVVAHVLAHRPVTVHLAGPSIKNQATHTRSSPSFFSAAAGRSAFQQVRFGKVRLGQVGQA